MSTKNQQLVADVVQIIRDEANFDRACDTAYFLALVKFGIDENWNAGRILGWDQKNCSVHIHFRRYSRIGKNHHLYTFFAEVIKSEKEDFIQDNQKEK